MIIMTTADTTRMESSNPYNQSRLRSFSLREDEKTGTETGSKLPNQPSILEQADKLINGDRQKDYGDKLQNFSQTSMLWQGILAAKLAPGQFITAEDVALCMIQVKLSRLVKSPDHKDSILDVAGYAGCYDILQRERAHGVGLHGATQDYRKDANIR